MGLKDDNQSGKLLIFNSKSHKHDNIVVVSSLASKYCKFLGNSGEVAGTVVEFMEVAITMIVFLKGFYPSGE